MKTVVFWKPGVRNLYFVRLGQLIVTDLALGLAALSSHMEANTRFHQEKQLL